MVFQWAWRVTVPIPKRDPRDTCVVETGRLNLDAPMTRKAVTTFAVKPRARTPTGQPFNVNLTVPYRTSRRIVPSCLLRMNTWLSGPAPKRRSARGDGSWPCSMFFA